MILVGDDIEDEAARPMRLDLAPVLLAWRIYRRLEDAVILRAAGIGEDNETAVAMIHGVVVLRLTRRD